MNQANNYTILKEFRPALRSAWFLFFGLALGPAILFFERDPEGSPVKWVMLSLACLGLILHRYSLRYTLSEERLTANSWWGLGKEETVTLKCLREVRSAQGFAGRLAGCGHLEVLSDAYDESGISVLGLPNYLELAEEIRRLALAAGKSGDNGSEG